MRHFRVALASAVLGLALTSTPARAQVLIGYLFGEKLATENFNMGFEVGMNFSSLDGLDGAERMNRPVFGLFADWRFSENVHLGGAVLPIAGRGAEGLAAAPTGDPGIDLQTAGRTMKRQLDYVEIPVLLKWAPEKDVGFRIGAGPSLGIVTHATDRYDCVTAAGAHYVLENDVKDALPGFDFGISIDAEYRLPLLAIAVRYTEGLTDMRQDGTSDEVHTRVLTGTGRIYLGKKTSP